MGCESLVLRGAEASLACTAQYSPRRPFPPLRGHTPEAVFLRAAPPSRKGGNAHALSIFRIPPYRGSWMRDAFGRRPWSAWEGIRGYRW